MTHESFFSRGRIREKRSGTIVSAEISEAVREKTIVKPTSLKSWPDMPFIREMGRKTTIVVMVDAMIAEFTRFAPSIAACS